MFTKVDAMNAFLKHGSLVLPDHLIDADLAEAQKELLAVGTFHEDAASLAGAPAAFHEAAPLAGTPAAFHDDAPLAGAASAASTNGERPRYYAASLAGAPTAFHDDTPLAGAAAAFLGDDAPLAGAAAAAAMNGERPRYYDVEGVQEFRKNGKWPLVQIRQSPTLKEGEMGVFATTAIFAREIVCCYDGYRLMETEFARRTNDLTHIETQRIEEYAVYTATNRMPIPFLYPYDRTYCTSFGHLLNHSPHVKQCCNVRKTYRVTLSGESVMCMVARRDIAEGEELLYFYYEKDNAKMSKEKNFRCPVPNCKLT